MALGISLIQLAVDPAVEANDAARSGISDESDLTALPRLEARRRPGRNIEAKTARLLAVEGERRVGLVEMIMRPDLDRTVPGIGDRQCHGRAAGVDLDIGRGSDNFSRDHVPSPSLRGAVEDEAISCRGAPIGPRLLRFARNNAFIFISGS